MNTATYMNLEAYEAANAGHGAKRLHTWYPEQYEARVRELAERFDRETLLATADEAGKGIDAWRKRNASMYAGQDLFDANRGPGSAACVVKLLREAAEIAAPRSNAQAQFCADFLGL